MVTISGFDFLDKQKLSALKSFIHLTPKCAFIFFQFKFFERIEYIKFEL